jgi:hypothetical protein
MADEAEREPNELQSSPGFLDLSDDLLAQISAGSHGFPLLALSRRGRDAVLGRARAIVLNFMLEQEDVAAAARLLDRACRAAKPGLQLEIEYGDTDKRFWLATLLQHGLDAGGWTSVHALSLMVREPASYTCVPQIASKACAAAHLRSLP